MIIKKDSSLDLKHYKKIEKSLWRLFSLFGNLCELCYLETISQIEKGNSRKKRIYWCCCLIDNQVHDHWGSLDLIQRRIDGVNWYRNLKIIHEEWRQGVLKRRFPGNGPCPALCSSGCIIKRGRPITCTTQFCEKMLLVFSKLKVIDVSFRTPLQIEDLLDLPSITGRLHGAGGGFIGINDAKPYLIGIKKLRDKFSKENLEKTQSVVNEAVTYFLK